jgi:hypothetical protein
MINVISDNALLLGYSRGVKKITPAIVNDCYDDMKLELYQIMLSCLATHGA